MKRRSLKRERQLIRWACARYGLSIRMLHMRKFLAWNWVWFLRSTPLARQVIINDVRRCVKRANA